MTDHQRWVMAGDMLLGAQRAQVPSAPLPSDAQIDRMHDAIQGVCSGDAYGLRAKVGGIAGTLYLMADDLKPGF